MRICDYICFRIEDWSLRTQRRGLWAYWDWGLLQSKTLTPFSFLVWLDSFYPTVRGPLASSMRWNYYTTLLCKKLSLVLPTTLRLFQPSVVTGVIAGPWTPINKILWWRSISINNLQVYYLDPKQPTHSKSAGQSPSIDYWHMVLGIQK